MTQIAELLQRQAALEHEISALKRADRLRAINDVLALMAEHELTVADLVSVRAPSAKSRSGTTATGKTVAAKYRDPGSGTTWSGRGLTPKWLSAKLAEGKVREDFALR